MIATFLHSQPLGQKADATDLYVLLAHPDIDKMSVEEGLNEWRKVSWFLKEDESIWCLGTTPNLTNMHVRAMERLNEDQITDNLVKRIKDARLGQNADGVVVHTLPNSPADIPDNPDLHFVIVGPEYAAVPGRSVPSSLEAFFDRTYRNNVITLAPENSRLAGLRYRIRKILGWQGIESGDEVSLLSKPQKAVLVQRKRDDETGILDSVKSTYSVLIAVDEAGEIKARLLPTGAEPPFERVKTFLAEEERLLTTSLDPDLLTPDSFFELWGDDETSKPVQRLYGMFASLPRLPRLLGRKVFIETLRRGVMEGRIVLRTVRPDGSQHTFWRESPSDEDLSKRDLEIVPIEHAELHNLSPDLLLPSRLPELWQGENVPITVSAIREFFEGDDVPKLAKNEVLFNAIRSTVQSGLLMALSPCKAYLKDVIPDAEMCDDLELLVPLQTINGSELGTNTLSEAWEQEVSSVGQIIRALAKHKGTPIPWSLVVDAITDGLEKRIFEIIDGSPAWPCTADKADKIGLQVSRAPVTIVPADLIGDDVIPVWESGQPTLGVIKETLESNRGVSIRDDVFLNAVKGAINSGLIISDDPLTNDLYQIHVRQPPWICLTEAHLTEAEIQDLTETISDLAEIAPELDFRFRITITAEGEAPSNEVLNQINEILGKVTEKLTFEVSP